jgi:hypothetical protein
MFVSAADETRPNRRIVLPETLNALPGRAPADPRYDGKPLSYWLRIIRDRNEEMMPLAFDAIRGLGPDAWPAVPELTRVITAPFSPIRVGKDSDELLASKLFDIQVRENAIDTLPFVGDAAASATVSLVRWALMVRVIPPPEPGNREEYELFVDLVTMDIEQRMRVIDAVAAFKYAAAPTLERLLKVPDDETRKLAVAILGGEALSLAADLLKSDDCKDQALGILMLKDMELVVAREHLKNLIPAVVCHAN